MSGISEFRGELVEKLLDQDVMKADKSGSYKAHILRYKTVTGKILEDRFVVGYLAKATALKKGFDSVNVGDSIVVVKDTSTKPWKIKDIAIDNGATRSTNFSGSKGSSDKSNPDVQRAIIRQNALTNAVNYLAGHEVTPDEVISVAKQFELYSAGEYDKVKSLGELSELMND